MTEERCAANPELPSGGCPDIKTVLVLQQKILDGQEALNRRFANAFVDGDENTHRQYHETIVSMLEERRELRKAIQQKTISSLVWVAVVWLGTVICADVSAKIEAGLSMLGKVK